MDSQTSFDHIYDSRRIDLALTVLDKEFRKLFLGLSKDSWEAINKSMRGWADNPGDYHLSGEQLRDFWDSFAAVMECIKLKPNFTTLVTAENANWQRTSLPITAIEVTQMLKQLKSVPGLSFRKHIPMSEVIDILTQNQTELAHQKQLAAAHNTDSGQDKYPIIVSKIADNRYRIIDGNRRTLLAALTNKPNIDAWVVELAGDKPTNFWVPLNDMLQLVTYYKKALDDANERSQQAVALLLHGLFTESQLAEYLYRIRIGVYDESAQELYELAKTEGLD